MRGTRRRGPRVRSAAQVLVRTCTRPILRADVYGRQEAACVLPGTDRAENWGGTDLQGPLHLQAVWAAVKDSVINERHAVLTPAPLLSVCATLLMIHGVAP